jgi:hypothetical protein
MFQKNEVRKNRKTQTIGSGYITLITGQADLYLPEHRG